MSMMSQFTDDVRFLLDRETDRAGGGETAACPFLGQSAPLWLQLTHRQAYSGSAPSLVFLSEYSGYAVVVSEISMLHCKQLLLIYGQFSTVKYCFHVKQFCTVVSNALWAA